MKDEKEKVIGFEALYESMMRCKRNVLWKDSVAHFYLNGIEETLKLERQLKEGTYKPREPKKFSVTHPKKREIVSIAFRDRVYQRSLNDNVLYPEMSRSFIYDNMACQKGKGTDFSINRLNQFMKKAHKAHGMNVYVLQCDIQGYYPNMSHAVAEETFRKKLKDVFYQMTEKVLQEQYEGDKGYNPGSQMIQIAGISVLSPLDHFIKEVLHIKWYLRYMDDFVLIHPDKDYLAYCEKRIKEFLSKIEFKLHPDKTRIYPIKSGIKMLGFTHRLTSTGKVVRIIDPKNVKSERKKLRRMVNLVRSGRLPKQKVDECYSTWKAHVRKGNSTQLLKRMEKYYADLWRESI